MRLSNVSEKSWSDYSESDYTVEQYHNACLIHQHQGAPTSKGHCKLPVKTPDGTVNRNAVHAAAAALGGARGGVQASDEEKAKARRTLTRLYRQMDEEPPPELVRHAGIDALVHYGVKGMKWGVRRTQAQIDAASEDASKAASTKAKIKKNKGSTHSLSNNELQSLVTRMNLERQYSTLANQAKPKSAGRKFAEAMLGNIAKQQVQRVASDFATQQVNAAMKKNT